MPKNLSLRVESVNPKTRLDIYLANQALEDFPTLSRSQVQNLIRSGQVKVDQRTITKPGFELKPGMSIDLQLAPADEHIKATDLPLDIIHEDPHLLVINKPAGISMHPGAGRKDSTLLNACLKYVNDRIDAFPSGARPGIVHRLDKDTTGLIVFARTANAHVALAKQFSDRTIQRAYQVLVATTPRARRLVQRQDSGTIETLIGRNPNDRKQQTVVEQGGKQAITHWKIIERFHYGCLLDIKLATGRTHQIRVHMQYIDSPVVGDRTYGKVDFLPTDLQRYVTQFGRQALHAYRLGFVHPATQQAVTYQVPLPADMQQLIAEFRKQN